MPYLKIKKQNSLDRTPALSDLALFVRFLCGQTFQKSKLHALPLFPASFSHFTPSCLSCHPSITNQFHHDTLSKWAFVVLILLSFSSVFTTERHSFLPEAPFALSFRETHSSRYVPVHSLLLLRLLCQLPLLYPTWNGYFLALDLGFFFSTWEISFKPMV